MSATSVSASVSRVSASATKRLVVALYFVSVLAERELSVGADRPQSPLYPWSERGGVQEGLDRVSPLKPGGSWWHRDRCVVGEHGDHGADVRALPGVNEAVDQFAQPLIADGLQRGLLASCGQSVVDGVVRALQRGVHRGRCHLERLGHLSCREAEHIPEDQDRALLRRDVL